MRATLAALLCACGGIDSNVGSGDLLATIDGARVVVVGGDQLYVAGETGLYRVPAAGGSPVLIDGNDSIYQVVADESAVYWTAGDGVFAYRIGTVVRDKLGDATQSITPLVADDVALYHADYYGQVWRTPKAGGGNVLFGMTDTTVGYLAVSPEGLWVTTQAGAKRLGAQPTERTFAGGLADGLTWFENNLYIEYAGTGDDDGSVLRAPNDVLAEGLVLPDGVLTTPEGVYITTGNLDASVRRIPLGGGGSEAIAAGNRPSSIAIDETYLYWTDPYPGEVHRLAR